MPMLLTITVFLPLIGSLILFLMPMWSYKTARQFALATSLITFVLSLFLLIGFQVGTTRPDLPQFSTSTDWLTVGNSAIKFALGLDGISLCLFALSTLLVIPSIFSSWESVKERAAAHYGLILALETGLLGLFASLDVVLFYIFFEFTLIPLFFLIGLYGGPERRRAAITFFLYTLAGSLLTLIGVVSLVMINQSYSADHVLTFSIPELTKSLPNLNWGDWHVVHTWGEWGPRHLFSAEWWDKVWGFWLSPQVMIFMLLFAGFAIKVPLFPFHTWLPLAHVEAPTAGSILLAGVLLKVGAYGFLRFNMAMVPLGAQALLPFLGTIAVLGILYGALTALAQTDVKRLVAYSSVSHMGFIALGLFSMTKTGTDGAVIQMVNHGLTTGALFACVGIFYERYHTREMSELSGLWERLPILAFFLILASLGSAAVPGLNGFVGEFPILLGMFSRNATFGILAAVGMVIGAYYLLIMLQRVIFGPLREPGAQDGHGHGPASHAESIRPIGWHEIAGLTPLMALIILIGIYPKPLFDRISPAVGIIARHYPPEPDRGVAVKVAHVDPAPVKSLANLPQDRAR
ncbi:MAG: nuoM [Planctomycetota bacterium]|nr:nuoM [Planctomycetota bacterium]